MGEAFGLETAQLYVQLQSILDLFSIDKASGEDLDERALDFGLVRNQPTKSVGAVNIGDSNYSPSNTAFSTLSVGVIGGTSTTAVIQTADYAAFPATGTIILSRSDVGTREPVAYSSKTAPNILNLATLPVFSHGIGAEVFLSTVGVDRTITTGTILQSVAPVIKFETTETAILYDGDYRVIGVTAQSVETGAANNVSGGTILQFQSNPFPTATVTNPSNFYAGTDLETDTAFRLRIKAHLQNLSSSTRVRVEYEAQQVQIAATGQRVITAKLIEPIIPGVMLLCINDGTVSYLPTTVSIYATEFIIPVANNGERRGILANWPIVNNSERLYVSRERGVATFVAAADITDSSKSWGVNVWTGYKVKDENSNIFGILSNTGSTLTLDVSTPIPQLGAYAIFDPSNTTYAAGGSLLVKGVNYIINNTSGQFELDITTIPAGLLQNDVLMAYYNGVNPAYGFYDGLIQETQHVITGDVNNTAQYPGVIAAGSICEITVPSVISVTVAGALSAKPGVAESTLVDAVKSAIIDYINNLKIGDDVIRNQIIAAAVNVPGVLDFAMFTPTSNIPVSDAQLAKTDIMLITVT
jgi:uncharacterized phage protein gp47/JayE